MTSSSESAAGNPTGTGTYPGWDVMVLLVLVAVMPAAFATGFSQFEHLKEWILVGGVGMAAGLWALRVAFADRVRVEAVRIGLLGLAVAVYVATSAFWSGDVASAVTAALPIVAGFVAFWIALSGEHRPTFGEFSVAVAVGVVVSAALGILDWAGVETFSVVWDPPGATGGFDGMEFAAAYYMVALPIVAAGAVRFSGWRGGLTAVAVGLGGLHFGATASWTLILLLVGAVFASGVCAALFQPTEAEVMTPAAGGVLAILLAGIVAGHAQHGTPAGMEEAVSVPLLSETASSEQQRLKQNRPWNPVFSIGRMETIHSMDSRRYLAEVGYRLWWDRAFLGHGAGSWWRLQTKYPEADHPAVQRQFERYPAYRAPHNAFVHVAVEYGVIGGTLLLLWLLAAAGLTIRAIGREPEPLDVLAEQWGLIGALIAGVAAASWTAFWTVSPALLTWIVAMAVLIRISVEMTAETSSQEGWELVSSRDDGWTASRLSVCGFAAVLATGMVVASTYNGTSRLYRGYADHAMLYTAYTKAAKLYDRVGEWWPAPGDVQYNQALAEQRSVGGEQDAGTLLERAVADRPYDTRVLSERASHLFKQEKTAKATSMAYRAVEAYPNAFVSRSVLTTALKRSNRNDEAANQLLDYLERKPPTALEVQTRQSLADLYESIGEPQNAKEHLERALDATELRSTKQVLRKQLKKINKKLEKRQRMREGKLPKRQQDQLPKGKSPLSPPGK